MSEYREPKLTHLCDLHFDLEPPQMIGPTPNGMRQIFPVKSGTAKGRINGEFLPGGGDWSTMRSDGTVQLDIRATLKTDDGALVYTYYNGIVKITMEQYGQILSGQEVSLEDYYSYITPLFQTAAPQLAWLNQVVTIGRGRIIPNGVEYRVWTVE